MEWRPYPFLTFNKTAAWGWYFLVCLCHYRPSRQEGLEDLWWLREDQWSPDDQAFSHRTRHGISDVSRSYAGSLPLQRLMNIYLYKSSILPLLTYCHAVWHFRKASDTRKIERVQERTRLSIGPKMKTTKHFWKEPGCHHWKIGGYRT